MNYTNINQQKIIEFKNSLNILTELGRESLNRCYNMDDYQDENRENKDEYPNCMAFWHNYHTEAHRISLFYMAHFYYNTSMTLEDRKIIETYIKEFNQSVFKMDTAEEMESWGGEDAPIAEHLFMYYSIHDMDYAFKNAKKQKIKRALRQFAQRSKTSTAVSLFMGSCNQAVPELLRTTMQYVGHTGY